MDSEAKACKPERPAGSGGFRGIPDALALLYKANGQLHFRQG
jgi:hypothetical protein